MMTDKAELKALEYRGRAAAALALAEACLLDRIRERHEQAAAKWTELAVAEENRVNSRRAVQN